MQQDIDDNRAMLKLVLFWAYVAIPLAWGVWMTVQKSLPLFH